MKKPQNCEEYSYIQMEFTS